MKKRDIWILVLVLVFLASGIVENPVSRIARSVVGDVQKAWTTPKIQPDVPTMSATEVCQYANQALPNNYIYQTPALRYEYRYTALSAQYIGGSSHKGAWEISVRETVEYQRLYEGQWTLFSRGRPAVSQTVEYIFNEVTGAVTRK